MLKRIFAVTFRDLKSGLRDYTILYILIAPFLLALILKAFVPSVGINLIHTAVLDTMDSGWIEKLEEYGAVESVSTRDALESRIKDTDDVFGLVETQSGTIEIIAAGDELDGSLDQVRAVINGIQNEDLDLPIRVTFTDVGWRLSPLLQHGTSLMLLV
jgi:ABC-2 type transport system permease protein